MTIVAAGPGGTVEGEVVSSTVSAHAVSVPARRELKPLVADWLKDRDEFINTVVDVGHRTGHSLLWHVGHSPVHAARVLKYAPRGAYRVTRAVWAWVFHAETKEMRRDTALNRQTPEWLKLEKERKERVSLRWRGVALLASLTLLILVLLWFLMPDIPLLFGVELTRDGLFTSLGLAVLCGLGYAGRPLNKKTPLFQHATTTNGDQRLTNDLVLEALCSLGIARMKDPAEIVLLYGVKPTRAGYSIDLILPSGVTAEEVMKKRKDLSSALQRNIGKVWPMRGPEHEGHLRLFISHVIVSNAEQKPWPLLTQGTVDLYKPVPMFTTQQGDWIDLTLGNARGVVGACSGMGKTHFLRQVALVGGLDPRCQVNLFDLKESGDLRCVKLFAHYYSDSIEEEDIAEHLEVLRKLKAERRRRAKVLKTLPDAQIPDGEVTSELASNLRLGLHPVMIIVDEADLWTCHPTYGGEFNDLLEDMARRGRSVGMTLWLASQEISAKTIPPVITRQASIRAAFRVTSHNETDQVLGSGKSSAGMRPHLFDPSDVGIAWIIAKNVQEIGRSIGALNKVVAEKVALRARAARQMAGLLSGQAAGEEMEHEADQVVLLDDVRRVFGPAKAMHLTDIAEALAALRPLLYGGLDAESLGAQLRAAGVRTGSVHVPGKPREKASNKGVKREWLDVAATELIGEEEADEEARSNVRPLRRLTNDEVLTGKGRPS